MTNAPADSPSARVRARAARSDTVRATRQGASAPRLGIGVRDLGDQLWPILMRHATAAWLAVVMPCLALLAIGTVRGIWYDGAVLALVLAGVVGWFVAALSAAERAVRRFRFEHATTPRVGRYLLLPSFVSAAPELLLLAGLTIYLFEHVRVVRRSTRGRPNAGARTTYEIGIRDLARRYAAEQGWPQTRGVALARRLVELGIVREVRISQAIGWRLAHRSEHDALTTLEAAFGAQIIDWRTGSSPED